MRTLAPYQQATVVRDLCNLHRSSEAEHVEPGVVVLLNRLPGMPRTQEPGLSSRRCVRLAVYRLLRALAGPDEVNDTAARILTRVKALASNAVLVRPMVHPLPSDEKLVSEDVAGELGRAFADEIRAALEYDAIDEPNDYADLLTFVAEVGTPIDLPATPEVAFRIAHSAPPRDSIDVGMIQRLNWDHFALLYGDLDTPRERVRQMCTDFDKRRWEPRLEEWRIAVEDALARLPQLSAKTLVRH